MELETLVAAASNQNTKSSLTLLRFLRTSTDRRSDLVLRYGEPLLSRSLGDEHWNVLEQVFIAALDVGNTELSDRCITELRKRFPSSVRVKRLIGMKHEAAGDFNVARAIYENVLKEDQNHPMIWKRLVAMYRASGQTGEAIRELKKYLTMFCVDFSAWAELAELYLELREYAGAAFCYEELIMKEPSNYAHHLAYAETQYSKGDMALALQYFLQATQCNRDCVRAMCGGLRAATAILTGAHAASHIFDTYTSLREMLLEAYATRGGASAALMQRVFPVDPRTGSKGGEDKGKGAAAPGDRSAGPAVERRETSSKVEDID